MELDKIVFIMSKFLLSTRNIALRTTKLYRNNVMVTTTWQQNRFMSLPGFVSSEKNDFRQIGTEKDAGALQDLLRRVMEIDAEITNTPVVDFKPNTLDCTAYCTADKFDINLIISSIQNDSDFHVASNKSSNMIHILDQACGGDIYLFSNGTFVCWGLNPSQQEKFIKNHVQSTSSVLCSKENIEYIIDEDELTDVKGDMVLLNPHIPSIDLSKVAFSYGLGRVAKLTSIEKMLDEYLIHFDSLPSTLQLNKKNLVPQLFAIRQRMIRGSQDGFLGTDDFQWTKPELESYVKKISSRFDVYTRIQILNKKIEYAIDITNTIIP